MNKKQNMNKRFNAKILSFAKKLKAIEYLGGKCKICGNDKWYNLEFHHNTGKKECNINSLKEYRWSKIEKELKKCVLYCANCHQEYHFLKRNSKDNRQISKMVYIEYKGSICEECGYNKCQASLSFHHVDPSKKEFNIWSLNERINSIEELTENITKEFDKCQLLCKNCHRLKHTDILFFETNRNLILEKMKTMKERKIIDIKKVLEMYDSGLRQVDIRKELLLSKSTISDIIKRNRK